MNNECDFDFLWDGLVDLAVERFYIQKEDGAYVKLFNIPEWERGIK